jgi:hypothetical protein
MIKRRESEQSFLKDLHEKYYGKKKRRQQRRDEKEKQLWLFDDLKKR